MVAQVLARHLLATLALVAIVGVARVPAAASTVDWQACQSDLERLRRAAGAAAQAAGDLPWKASALSWAESQLTSCYDGSRYGSGRSCSFEYSHYTSAVWDFESAKRDLDRAFEAISSRWSAATESRLKKYEPPYTAEELQEGHVCAMVLRYPPDQVPELLQELRKICEKHRRLRSVPRQR